uniref:Ammonium transporter AmtB-like domain-containing protein n=1 Tax=Globodera rostochiensis TaxID=31243 RepID=A0A914HVX0_GLORO
MNNSSSPEAADLELLRQLQFRVAQVRLDLDAFRSHNDDNQNAFFLTFMALMIFLMQCGFAFLEAGAVQAKNVTNILTKNVLDSLITIVSYWTLGWALAYGPNPDISNFGRFFFQYVFAARASTIISGAVAERAEFITFFVYSLLVPGFTYPVLSHWGWSSVGWLRQGPNIGDGTFHTTYLDLAGAGVVHLCGGTISLIAAWMMGPRIGRFLDNGQLSKMEGHSVPLASLGGFILMLGFLAFNGGSVADISLPGNGQVVAKAMINTLLCGAFGAICTLILHKIRNGKWTVLLTMNACFSRNGRISACAGCNQMDGWGTFVTGIGAGLIYMALSGLMLRLRIDDPLDAFAVHFGGGLWGLISVCLVSTSAGRGVIPSLITGDGTAIVRSLAQLGWNILSSLAIILWSSFVVLPVFGLLKLIGKFRVPAEIERKGIDIWKHGEEAYPLVAYGHGWNEAEAEEDEEGVWGAPVATIFHDPSKYQQQQQEDGGSRKRTFVRNGH